MSNPIGFSGPGSSVFGPGGGGGGSGGWSGVGQKDYGYLEWRLKQMQADMNIMWNRLNDLEEARDEKVEPEEVEGVDCSHMNPGKGYETATVKIDPVKINPDPSKLESNKDYALDWYINQYQNMCKEYNKVKIELDGKQSTLEMYIDQNHKFFDQIKKFEKKLDDKQKVLEMVMDQRDRYIKQLMDTEKKVKDLDRANYDLNTGNQILRGTIENFEDRILELEEEVKYHKAFAGSEKIKELDKPHATQLLPTQLNDYIDVLGNLAKKNKKIDDLTKKYEGEKAAAIKLEESSTYWQQEYNKQLQETDFLNKRLDFFEKMSYDLEMEKKDAKWYREQAIEKCIDIAERIKNDPLTIGVCKRQMIAICEDIQKAIKNEFGVK